MLHYQVQALQLVQLSKIGEIQIVKESRAQRLLF